MPKKRSIILFLLTASIPFWATPLFNNYNSKKSLALLEESITHGMTLTGSTAYVTSNRGDCIQFAATSFQTDHKLGDIKAIWEKLNESNKQEIDFIWKENGQDSVLLFPNELTPITYLPPVNLSFYGSDVKTGINELLARNQNTGINIGIFFTLHQKSNIFDLRCY